MRKTILYLSTMYVYQNAYVIFADIESYSTVYAELVTDYEFILTVPISVRQIANSIA